MRILGIDEAGRGCVLGPLFVGAFLLESCSEEDLRQAGANDSKLLSAKKRLEIRERLSSKGQVDVRRIEPAQIDAGNLNELEENLIAELVSTWRPDRVVIDALGHPRTLPAILARLQSKVRNAPSNQEWLMEPKADSRWPVVGAASIFAKTDRDAALEESAKKYGILGSGYPSDPKTKKWLADWHHSGRPWPEIVRTRWETVQALEAPRLF